jgi:hypothetical protein
MTVLIGRQCKSGQEEESFVVTWYKDRLLPHKKPHSHKNAVSKFFSDTLNLFGVGSTSRTQVTSNQNSSPDFEVDFDNVEMSRVPGDDLCSIEMRPPSSLALLIQEEITTTPVATGSALPGGVHHHHYQGSPTLSSKGSTSGQPFLHPDPVALVHARQA